MEVYFSIPSAGELNGVEMLRGQVIKGWVVGIKTMKNGENSIFTIPAELAYGEAGSLPTITPSATLQLDVKDICKDGGIFKKIIDEGEKWSNPRDLYEILVNYETRLEEGTLLAKPDAAEFAVQDGNFCPVKTMKKGEKVILTVNRQYGFEGYERSDDGSVVKLKLIGNLEDGTDFMKKGHVDGENLFEFKTNEEKVIEGLDRAVSTKKKGEVALLIIVPELAFGHVESKRELAVVPPYSTEQVMDGLVVPYQVAMIGGRGARGGGGRGDGFGGRGLNAVRGGGRVGPGGGGGGGGGGRGGPGGGGGRGGPGGGGRGGPGGGGDGGGGDDDDDTDSDVSGITDEFYFYSMEEVIEELRGIGGPPRMNAHLLRFIRMLDPNDDEREDFVHYVEGELNEGRGLTRIIELVLLLQVSPERPITRVELRDAVDVELGRLITGFDNY